VKSYIKIYGPPFVKALRALEKIAVESPEVLIKSFYDTFLSSLALDYTDESQDYISSIPLEVPVGRRVRLISKSGHTLGDYDFFFEWARDPTWEELQDLTSKIDKALGPLGCKYTIVTK
jgi:hypothetical protein